MSFTIRTLARRSATQIKRQGASVRRAAPMVSRRGYANMHGAADKTSDMPWLVGSIVVTAVGLAYLLSGTSAATGSRSDLHHEIEVREHTTPPGKPPHTPDDKPAGDNSAPLGARDPSAPGKASPKGQEVPPPSSDNTDLAENWEERKKGHEEFKARTRAGDTKVATASSTAPSKKTSAEDPREDPKKGEGEAVQKSDSKEDST
ncbi:hypothetical protein GGR55DRAFT_436112 [Xylaria sp. FL0064]|nr:hypothetical protein GGR55DRAFT_436112 [Xylaria sp. FL0064]